MDAGEQNADIALMFGDILVQRKQYDKALMHFQYAEEQYPTDYRFPYFLAQIYFETQALEDALRWCEEAERRADDPEARGRVLSMRRRVEDALIDRELQVLRDRCDRDPENMDLRLQYIAELARHNMAERAVGEYDELMEKRPELKQRIVAQLEEFASNPERHFRLMDYLADLKLKDRLYDDAFALACKLADKSMHPDHLLAEHCRRILRRRPDHLPSLRCLGQIMKKRQEWDQVLELYQRYQKLTDDDIKEVRESIFLANMHLGHVKEALELGESFLREYPLRGGDARACGTALCAPV